MRVYPCIVVTSKIQGSEPILGIRAIKVPIMIILRPKINMKRNDDFKFVRLDNCRNSLILTFVTFH